MDPTSLAKSTVRCLLLPLHRNIVAPVIRRVIPRSANERQGNSQVLPPRGNVYHTLLMRWVGPVLLRRRSSSSIACIGRTCTSAKLKFKQVRMHHCKIDRNTLDMLRAPPQPRSEGCLISQFTHKVLDTLRVPQEPHSESYFAYSSYTNCLLTVDTVERTGCGHSVGILCVNGRGHPGSSTGSS